MHSWRLYFPILWNLNIGFGFNLTTLSQSFISLPGKEKYSLMFSYHNIILQFSNCYVMICINTNQLKQLLYCYLYLALEEQVGRLPSVLSIAGHNGCLLWKLGNFQDILSILTFRQICWYIFILKTYKVFEPLYFPTPFIYPICVPTVYRTEHINIIKWVGHSNFFSKHWILGKSVSLNCFVIFVFQRKSLLYQSNLPASSHKNL